MTNYAYCKQMKLMMFGSALAKLLGTTWFGQPAGLCIGEDILADRLNFLINWQMKGAITLEQLHEVYSEYKAIKAFNFEAVDTGDDGLGYDMDYTFSEDDYRRVRDEFVRIYEVNVPELVR